MAVSRKATVLNCVSFVLVLYAAQGAAVGATKCSFKGVEGNCLPSKECFGRAVSFYDGATGCKHLAKDIQCCLPTTDVDPNESAHMTDSADTSTGTSTSTTEDTVTSDNDLPKLTTAPKDGVVTETPVDNSKTQVLRSGGGSRSMTMSTCWDRRIGLGPFDTYGISGGSWGLAVRALVDPAKALIEWKSYLSAPLTISDKLRDYGLIRSYVDTARTITVAETTPAAWNGELRRFLGSFFSRATVTASNYHGYYAEWGNYVEGAVLRPLGKTSSGYRMKRSDHIQIGYVDERYNTDTRFQGFSVIDMDAKNKWTVYHPDGSHESMTALDWRYNVHTTGGSQRVSDPVPLTMATALLLTSSAFTGTSRFIGSHTKRFRDVLLGVNVFAVLDGRVRDAQVFDFGNDCNIPLPFYKPADGKTFISIDASDQATPYSEVNRCILLWRSWGWTAQKLTSYGSWKAEVDGRKTGLSILKLTHRTGEAHLINIPIATIPAGGDAVMAMQGINTLTATQYPVRFGVTEVETVEERVDKYYEQLRALDAMPAKIATMSSPSDTTNPDTETVHRTENLVRRVDAIMSGDACECQSEASGSYQPGLLSERCDKWGEPYYWCYVKGRGDCIGATQSIANKALYWKKCDRNCDCSSEAFGKYQPKWYSSKCNDYGENYNWCYVEGGEHCERATQSTADPSKYWIEC